VRSGGLAVILFFIGAKMLVIDVTTSQRRPRSLSLAWPWWPRSVFLYS
jgi:hypothetical protein